MPTQCIPEQMEFQGLGSRKVIADFSGGRVTSDAGGLLLREAAEGSKILREFADCFSDYRDPDRIARSSRHALPLRFRLLLGRIWGVVRSAG